MKTLSPSVFFICLSILTITACGGGSNGGSDGGSTSGEITVEQFAEFLSQNGVWELIGKTNFQKAGNITNDVAADIALDEYSVDYFRFANVGTVNETSQSCGESPISNDVAFLALNAYAEEDGIDDFIYEAEGNFLANDTDLDVFLGCTPLSIQYIKNNNSSVSVNAICSGETLASFTFNKLNTSSIYFNELSFSANAFPDINEGTPACVEDTMVAIDAQYTPMPNSLNRGDISEVSRSIEIAAVHGTNAADYLNIEIDFFNQELTAGTTYNINPLSDDDQNLFVEFSSPLFPDEDDIFADGGTLTINTIDQDIISGSYNAITNEGIFSGSFSIKQP